MASRSTQTATRSRRAAPPPQVETEESREMKFRRLTQARVTRARNALRLIGNTFSPNYASTPEQRMLIIDTLQSDLDILRSKASRPKGKHTLSFEWGEQETAH